MSSSTSKSSKPAGGTGPQGGRKPGGVAPISQILLSPEEIALATSTIAGDGNGPFKTAGELGEASLAAADAAGASLGHFIANSPYIPTNFNSYPPIESSRFRIEVVQQPTAARSCMPGDRDRRPIDGPPIVQLTMVDFDPESLEDFRILNDSLNVVHCGLLSVPHPSATPEEGKDISWELDPANPKVAVRRLFGTQTKAPWIGTDPQKPTDIHERLQTGYFFIYDDLCCRKTGLFRLWFVLINLTRMVNGERKAEKVGARAFSDIFEVYPPKSFPGLRKPSPLSLDLKAQGAIIGIRGTRAAAAGARRSEAIEESRAIEEEGAVDQIDEGTMSMLEGDPQSMADEADDSIMSVAEGKKPLQ